MTAVTPGLPTIDELKSRISGPVLLPGDEGYEAEFAPFNLSCHHTPGVVVGVNTADDVSAAVRWATANGMPIAVQGTGHGAVMACPPNAMLVITKRMQGIEIDPVAQTARVEAGVKWLPVLEAAAKHGLSTLNGSATDVGVIGYVTGGGVPILGRKYGFAADHVREFEIVTADGEIRTCSPTSEPDLFWAVRGGKGNFGIVTSMTVELIPVPTLYGGAIFWEGEHAAEVLHTWREWTADLPDDMCTSVALLRLPDLPFVPPPLAGKLTVTLRVAYPGDPTQGERLLAEMRAVAPAIIDAVGEMPYTQIDEIHHDPVDPIPAWERGGGLTTLPAEAVDALLEVAGPGKEIPLIMCEFRHFGGAFARTPEHPNAVSGRRAAYTYWVLGPMFPGLDAIVPGIGHAAYDALKPWRYGSAPVNFVGHTPAAEVARTWEPEIYQRLIAIKRAVDPTNVFRFGHTLEPISIPEQAPPSE